MPRNMMTQQERFKLNMWLNDRKKYCETHTISEILFKVASEYGPGITKPHLNTCLKAIEVKPFSGRGKSTAEIEKEGLTKDIKILTEAVIDLYGEVGLVVPGAVKYVSDRHRLQNGGSIDLDSNDGSIASIIDSLED